MQKGQHHNVTTPLFLNDKTEKTNRRLVNRHEKRVATTLTLQIDLEPKDASLEESRRFGDTPDRGSPFVLFADLSNTP